MVWQIQLIRHLMLKITPHTTQIFNIKYLLIELAKPYLGQKYILSIHFKLNSNMNLWLDGKGFDSL